jgi:hypothetical protein
MSEEMNSSLGEESAERFSHLGVHTCRSLVWHDVTDASRSHRVSWAGCAPPRKLGRPPATAVRPLRFSARP